MKYELKLIRYKNEKEIEKTKKEDENSIAQKKLEKEKVIEFNELRNKSELVQKIISNFFLFLLFAEYIDIIFSRFIYVFYLFFRLIYLFTVVLFLL